jgi:soluble lytic murein transglycosylase
MDFRSMFGGRKLMPGEHEWNRPKSPFDVAPDAMEDAPQQRRGLFSGGFMQKAGDVGSILRDDPGIWENRQQMQQQGQLAQMQDIAKAEADKAENLRWYERENWKRDNPEPVKNDTVNDYEFMREQLGDDAAKQYLRSMGDPVVTVPLPNGQVYSGPRSGLAGAIGGGGPQEGATATNPNTGEKLMFKGGQWISAGGQPGGPSPLVRKVVGNLDHITMMAESGGNPRAVSPKGARGLMQVMPETARDPGFGIRPSNGSPADDVRVGKEYRAKMHARYGGNLAKMWGAYNWGPGNVDKAIADHGEGWFNHAPAETRNYIARNIRAATRGR